MAVAAAADINLRLVTSHTTILGVPHTQLDSTTPQPDTNKQRNGYNATIKPCAGINLRLVSSILQLSLVASHTTIVDQLTTDRRIKWSHTNYYIEKPWAGIISRSITSCIFGYLTVLTHNNLDQSTTARNKQKSGHNTTC